MALFKEAVGSSDDAVVGDVEINAGPVRLLFFHGDPDDAASLGAHPGAEAALNT